MRICTYFGVRFKSIGVEFVLGTKGTRKRNMLIIVMNLFGHKKLTFKPSNLVNGLLIE